jgi:hypothetical protein
MVLVQDASTTFNACCAGIATCCAVYVAFRDTLMRKRLGSQALFDRIQKAQSAADGWHETPPALEIKADIRRHAKLLAEHDGWPASLATKSDVAKIDTHVAGLAARVADAANGIDRIEGLLIKRAIEAK